MLWSWKGADSNDEPRSSPSSIVETDGTKKRVHASEPRSCSSSYQNVFVSRHRHVS
jgi:hypothetical protein